MKLGIITYHRAHNYGAVLQAYALKTYLQSQSDEVEILDYFPDYHEEHYKLWSWKLFWKRGIKNKIRSLITYPFIKVKKQKRRLKFLNFIENYIKPVMIPSKENPLDMVIYGSDQIWRDQSVLTPLFKGFNDVYFGNELIPAHKRISYAASMGNLVQTPEVKTYLKEALQRFDAISVREADLQVLIQPLTNKNVELVLDPVFLLSKKEWGSIAAPPLVREKYLLYYALQHNPELDQIVEQLGREKNLRVIRITGGIQRKENADVFSTIGPLEFFSLIQNADFVVSSSFHGVAFSIVLEKQFIAHLVKNSGRVETLLNNLGLQNRFIKNNEDIAHLKEIDYEEVSVKLTELKNHSTQYLTNHLS